MRLTDVIVILGLTENPLRHTDKGFSDGKGMGARESTDDNYFRPIEDLLKRAYQDTVRRHRQYRASLGWHGNARPTYRVDSPTDKADAVMIVLLG